MMASAQQNADFTVEYASNLSSLDSWSDISKFQWKAIDHGVIDNGDEMKRLIEVVKDAAPKDTVGFYKATTSISCCAWTRPRPSGSFMFA